MIENLGYDRVLDPQRTWCQAVTSHTGREHPTVKYHYKLDLEGYSWLESYLGDQKKRGEIEKFREEIAEVQNSKMDRNELKKSFVEQQEEIKKEFLGLIRGNLSTVQNRLNDLYGVVEHLEDRIFHLVPLAYLTDGDIENLFKDLPAGLKEEDVKKKVAETEERIKKLNAEIEKDFSPRDRWVYDGSGEPISYPRGCRWLVFVTDWYRIQQKFTLPVSVEGLLLKDSVEKKAWELLGLDEVVKLQPLKEPFEN